MRHLFARPDAGTLRLGLAAALMGLSSLLAPGGILPGAAAAPRSERAPLEQGPAAGDSDVGGSIQVRHTRRGDRVKIRLRNLEPRTGYDVRDGVTGSLLVHVTSNARGRAKGSFLSDGLSGGDPVGLAGLPLEICLEGTDEAVLEGQVPGDRDDDGANWTDFTYRTGTVGTGPDAEVQVHVSLNSVSGEGLEHPLDSISLDVGAPVYRIMNDDGTFGGGDGATIPGPVTFWIADGEGELHEVASLDGCKRDGDGDDDGHDGGDNGGDDGHDGDRSDGGISLLTRDGGDGNSGGDVDFPPDVPCDFFFWYADNTSDPGLPLGAATVDELVGRAFEVRDGEGNVLLEGVLPELEEIVFEDPWKDATFASGTVATEPDAAVQVAISLTSWSDGTDEGTFESISLFAASGYAYAMEGGMFGDDFVEIPGPVTFWIADGAGDLLVKVATIEASDEGLYYPMAGMNMPSYDGDDGYGGDFQWPAFYAWTVDNQSGDGLPLGVSRIAELSGRAFEVRDGEGNVLLDGVLPDLEEIPLDEPGTYVIPGVQVRDGVANW